MDKRPAADYPDDRDAENNHKNPEEFSMKSFADQVVSEGPAVSRRTVLHVAAGTAARRRVAAGGPRGGRGTQGADQAVGMPLVLRRLHEASTR